MKELSIEQKAEAYDKAIEGIQEILSSGQDSIKMSRLQLRLQGIFPELKENEDEKIRKEIISHLQYLAQYCRESMPNVDNWIAWLEKQGKETCWKPSKEEMDVLYGLAYITNQYDEHKEEVITRLYQDLKREFFNGSSYEDMFPTNTSIEDDVRRRSTIQVLEYARSLDTYNQYGKADIDKNIAWLEKQGKQKPFDYENINIQQKDFAPKSAIEAAKEKKIDNANKVEPKDYNSIDPHFGKPADKVEPNFKIEKDKWYVCTQTFVLRGKEVIIKGQTYQAEKDNVIKGEDGCLFVDRHDGKASDYFRLWTIQDAKEGDVLAFYCEYKGNKMVQVGIIEKYVGKHGGCSNTFKIYVGVDWENNLKIGEYMGCPDIRPATKEQRDKLFEKMHEAEYDWDTEKKELKKIEESENIKNQIMSEITDLVKDYITQKPARCSEEDELSCFESALFTAFSDAWQSYLLGEEVNVKQWTKEHSKELLEAAKEELKGHNSAWSEEDEKMVNDIIAAIDTLHYHGMVKWLKSLKQRMNNV